MKRCLRCNNMFTGTSVFCENCQSSLLNRSQLKEKLSQLDPATAGEEVRVQVAECMDAGASLAHIPTRSDSGWKTVPISDAGLAAVKHNGASEQAVLDPPASEARAGGEALAQQEQAAYRHPVLRIGRWRKIFLMLLILAISGIIIDSTLVILTFSRHSHDANGLDITPLMLLSNSVVNRGDRVTVHFLHCQPLSQVILLRDVQEPLYADAVRQPVHISANGEAVVQMLIDASWKPGSHRLKAEDIKTHYVIDSPLYISGLDPLQPAHLQVSQTIIDMGTETQWKDSTSSLELSNTGGGIVSWLASSDQSWLKFTPMQGRLSKPQHVFLSATRAHLAPGQHQGTITIASNAGASLTVHVKMNVLPQPARTAIVPGITPAVLGFDATDGGTDPGEQVVVINNPGMHALSWLLNKNVDIVSGQDLSNQTSWLNVEPTSGVITPGASVTLHVLVHSQPLLEGTYLRMLSLVTEQGGPAITQSLLVSLNVGRHCGVVTDTTDLFFTTTVGQNTQPRQELNLNASAECAGTFPWHAYSLSSWLRLTSDRGQLAAKAHGAVAVNINGRSLQAGPYNALLAIATSQRTDIILAQLTVLPASQSSLTQTTDGAPEPAKNVMLRITPANLVFATTQGRSSVPGQSVSIGSMENSAFSWRASIDADWLTLTPQKGTVAAGQSGQVVVSSNAAGLDAHTYIGHISITPQDAAGKPSGKPRVLTVTFNIAPECVLQVSPEKLSFSASFLQPNPPAQSITLKGGANCAYPVTWTASIVESSSRSWLAISPTSGSENGDGSTLTVSINRKEMLLGDYIGHITITAFDGNGAPVQEGAQTIVVTLNVFG